MTMHTGIGIFAGAMLALATASVAHAGDFRLEKSVELADGGSLSLRSEAGRVEVRGVASGPARVVVESERADFAELFEVSILQPRADRLEVRVEKRNRRPWSWTGTGRTRITVELPRSASAEIHTSGGRVEVREIDGDLRAESSGGGVVVEGIGGDVTLSSSGGGVDLEDVEGTATLESSGGSVSARAVRGDLKVSSSGGGVSLEEIGGAVVASSSGGPVRVGFAAGNGRGGSLSSSGGGVEARLDPSVALDLDAETSGGSVDCDLPVTVRGKISSGKLHGELNGGGPVLRLRSSGGGIRIRQR